MSRTFIHATNPRHPGVTLSADRALAEPGWRHRELACGHPIQQEMPRQLADLLIEAAQAGLIAGTVPTNGSATLARRLGSTMVEAVLQATTTISG